MALQDLTGRASDANARANSGSGLLWTDLDDRAVQQQVSEHAWIAVDMVCLSRFVLVFGLFPFGGSVVTWASLPRRDASRRSGSFLVSFAADEYVTHLAVGVRRSL